MILGTLISKYYSSGLFTVQFAIGEGVQHSCCVNCLIRNLTNVIPAIPCAMLTAVFGNMEHCMSPGVGEAISSSSLTNHLHSCQICLLVNFHYCGLSLLIHSLQYAPVWILLTYFLIFILSDVINSKFSYINMYVYAII
jgi:hypothetical protein